MKKKFTSWRLKKQRLKIEKMFGWVFSQLNFGQLKLSAAVILMLIFSTTTFSQVTLAPTPGTCSPFVPTVKSFPVIDGDPSEWPGILNNPAVTKKAYRTDPFNANGIDDQWTGGSQDPDANPAANWHWVLGNSNDKGDIANAGAALINDTLYFCGDRASINGDAQIGFWFFKGNIRKNADGSFSGSHVNGDLLVLSTFTNGGRISVPQVYEWLNGALTGPIAVTSALEAVNDAVIASPDNVTMNFPAPDNKWRFQAKGETSTCYLTNLFFEGKVYIGNIPEARCFTSFILETRNSQSVNASLQDLTAGSFSGVPNSPQVTGDKKCIDEQPLTLTANCSGNSVKWYATATSTNALTAADGVSADGTQLILSGLAVGTYTYYAACADGSCESPRVPVTGIIVGKPNVLAFASPTTSVSLSSTPPHFYLSSSVDDTLNNPSYTYLWTQDPPQGATTGTLSSTTIPNPTFTANRAGTYTWIVTASGFCSNKDTITRIITATLPCPNVNVAPVCPNTTNTYTADVAPDATETWLWSVNNGATIIGANNLQSVTVKAGTQTFTLLLTKTFSNPALAPLECPNTVVVKPTSSSTTTVSRCSNQLPYVWNGTSYSTAGTYTFTTTNSVGCDSVATLIFSIRQTTTSTTTVARCVNQLPFVWNGTSYSTAGTYSYTTTNAVGCDSVAVLVFTVKQTSTSTTTVSRCSNQLPYIWNGTSYSVAGTYNKTFTNSVGCDSVATLILTVRPTSTSSTSVSRCVNQLPYVWNGQSISTAGTYTYTTTNSVGCDSVASLVFTVRPTSTSTTNASRCSNQLPYVWNGQNISTAGTYTYTTTNSVGCDSVASLIFTVRPTSTSTTTVSRCSNQLPYAWNGQSISSTGTYTYTTTNSVGCDSVATLLFTVRQTSTSTTTVSRCSNQLPYVWNGTNYSTAGTFTKTFTNAAGCDSVATLILTIRPTSSSSTTVTICFDQSPYLWNGTYYDVAGTYSYTSTNSVGCDSVATLILIINPSPRVTVNSPVSCYASTITATPNYGTASDFNYVWTVPAGATNPGNVASFLATVGGTYSVVITDKTTQCYSPSGSGLFTLNNCAHIMPTQTTCCNYLNGPTYIFQLLQACTKVSGGIVTNAIPGVFFYYGDYVATTTGLDTIVIKQSRNTASNILRPFNPQNLANLRVYTSTCGTILPTSVAIGTGAELGYATITFNAVAGQRYVISAKYDVKSIVGSNAPAGTATYTFGMYLNGSATPISGSIGSIDVVSGCADNTPYPTGDCPTAIVAKSGSNADQTMSNAKNLTISAYPNPYLDKVNFQFVSPLSGKAILEIYDVLGRRLAVIFQGKIDAGIMNTAQYNVSRLNKAALFYKLTVDGKTVKGTIVPE